MQESSYHFTIILLRSFRPKFYFVELFKLVLFAANRGIIILKLTAFSISVRYLHICAPCRQRVADLLRIKDCRAATLCCQLFQKLINVIN